VNHFSCIASLWLVCGGLAVGAPDQLVHFSRTPYGGIQPQAAIDQHGTVHLVYLKGDPAGCDVFYVRRPRGSTNFSSPLRVNSEPGTAIAIGTVRGPQLALGLRDRVHVVWNGAQPARNAGAKGAPMLYSRLDDSGAQFEPERNLMTATMNLDGGGSVAADRAGNVYVVWHAHAITGEQDEMHRAVYVARSQDDGRTFTAERRVGPESSGVCGCCGLKAFVDQKARLEILFRSADDLGNRNSVFWVSDDQGQTFQSRTLGLWHSPTCPMSTGALEQGPDDAVAALWETQGQIFREFVRPDRLELSAAPVAAAGEAGGRKHPVFAFNRSKGRTFLVAWTEGTAWAKGGSLAWECTDLRTGTKTSGQLPGVPVWSLVAAVPEPDGTFTIIY
jgi:hypothetical protein